MPSDSLVNINVDFDRPGKQFGHLSVPRSTNSAGWANYFIPVTVIRNGDGPTAVLSGGNHGDEFEGPVTLMNLARRLLPEQINGRVILIPMLNKPAVIAGTRLSPLDGMNMNRAFPGRSDGTITSMIADFVTQVILPMADLVVDIHSGGSSMQFLPSVNMHNVGDREQMRQMVDAGRAWGAPYVLIYEDVAGGGLLPSQAESMGKVTLGTELGSKSQFGPKILEIAKHGVERVLHWQGILRARPTAAVTDDPAVVAADDTDDYVMAPATGLYEPFFELGDSVEAGQPLGQIHNIEHPDRDPEIVRAETSGILICRRAIPITAQGECVGVLVRPFEL